MGARPWRLRILQRFKLLQRKLACSFIGQLFIDAELLFEQHERKFKLISLSYLIK